MNFKRVRYSGCVNCLWLYLVIILFHNTVVDFFHFSSHCSSTRRAKEFKQHCKDLSRRTLFRNLFNDSYQNISNILFYFFFFLKLFGNYIIFRTMAILSNTRAYSTNSGISSTCDAAAAPTRNHLKRISSSGRVRKKKIAFPSPQTILFHAHTIFNRRRHHQYIKRMCVHTHTHEKIYCIIWYGRMIGEGKKREMDVRTVRKITVFLKFFGNAVT